MVNHLRYEAFGRITSETNAAVDFLFAFTGRERDEESGLFYYRARYYDPAVGRFISEDPLGFAAGDGNLARYVKNSPPQYRDSTGKEPVRGHIINPWTHEYRQIIIPDGVDPYDYVRQFYPGWVLDPAIGQPEPFFRHFFPLRPADPPQAGAGGKIPSIYDLLPPRPSGPPLPDPIFDLIVDPSIRITPDQERLLITLVPHLDNSGWGPLELKVIAQAWLTAPPRYGAGGWFSGGWCGGFVQSMCDTIPPFWQKQFRDRQTVLRVTPVWFKQVDPVGPNFVWKFVWEHSQLSPGHFALEVRFPDGFTAYFDNGWAAPGLPLSGFIQHNPGVFTLTPNAGIPLPTRPLEGPQSTEWDRPDWKREIVN
ncbi:MAG: hypothetical protein KatS3mg110_1923 [Pirellulaceae bacterium]|nr:MAG: hypothetical protein KatS3mg110_1923 [Pirellulaceae bacterium]